MECMAELTPDRLWPVLEEVLQTWQSRRRIRLILASGSPGPARAAGRAGFAFEVMPADIDEPETGFADPRIVHGDGGLAEGGRRRAAHRRRPDPGRRHHRLDRRRSILKPDDEADARRILRKLAGREHELWTGVVALAPARRLASAAGRSGRAWPSPR